MPNSDPLLYLQNNQKRISQIEGEKYKLKKVVNFRLLTFFKKSIMLFAFALICQYAIYKVDLMEEKGEHDNKNPPASSYNILVAKVFRDLFIAHAIFTIMRNDMGIRTRFVFVNVLIQYLLIVIRLVTLVAYIFNIFPRIIEVIR